jgi:hypothetical protein
VRRICRIKTCHLLFLFTKIKGEGILENSTSEYVSWCNMRQRCNNPNHPQYNYYGKRGIKVCERWNSFESFLIDMGEKPGKEYEVDRRDTNGNYEPSNCRWATRVQNSRNRRKHSNNNSGYKGVYFYKERKMFRAHIKVDKKDILIGRYETAIEAAKAYDIAAIKYFGEFAATNYSLGLLV